MAEVKMEGGESKNLDIVLPEGLRHYMSEFHNQRRRDEGKMAVTYPVCIGVMT
jgi:hypothetical protein